MAATASQAWIGWAAAITFIVVGVIQLKRLMRLRRSGGHDQDLVASAGIHLAMAAGMAAMVLPWSQPLPLRLVWFLGFSVAAGWAGGLLLTGASARHRHVVRDDLLASAGMGYMVNSVGNLTVVSLGFAGGFVVSATVALARLVGGQHRTRPWGEAAHAVMCAGMVGMFLISL
jgi:hypothetical protein